MKEIGGYLELDQYNLPMLHENGIKLNCGRNALAYLIKSKQIEKIYLPKFNCDCITSICKKFGIEFETYSINEYFRPIFEKELKENEYFYLINYYGQISNDEVKEYKKKYANLIFDNAQAYFQMPVQGIDTIYTCRKFFGVADGAILYTDDRLREDLKIDESFNRMKFVLGRYERNASEFYKESVLNNELFDNEPIKRMSKLTENLLHGIDYEMVKKKRKENFQYLHKKLIKYNALDLIVPEGPFMYPLFIKNGALIRKELQKNKIYIPTLWPNIFDECKENELEYQLAENILPLPCDQRYSTEDMEYMYKLILERIVD